MSFDEIFSTHVMIDGIKHIPYPKACPKSQLIDKCDYRVHREPFAANHEMCDIGFNGYFASGEEKQCIYADNPSMCPVFSVSCLDCENIGECSEDKFFVALSLDPCELGLERATHPLYRNSGTGKTLWKY